MSRSTRESRRHNTFSKDSLELSRFLYFHRTRRRLCTLKPASATYGAKLLLRKVPQYMGHNTVCQVGNYIFFAGVKFGLKRPIVAITSRQNPLVVIEGRQAVQYGERQRARRPPYCAACNIAAQKFSNGAIGYAITNTG